MVRSPDTTLYPIYIGSYTLPIVFGTGEILQSKGKGIGRVSLDTSDGRLLPGKTVGGVDNPSFLAVSHSKRFLYAVNELKSYAGQATGTVSAFRIEESTGDLVFLNRRITGGEDPCHVTVSTDDSLVFVSNYSSGSVCVLPVLADGSLAEMCQLVEHEGRSVHPVRQTGPHAHSLTLDPAGRFAVVPDLGIDHLMIYTVDPSGTGPVLTESGRVRLPEGHGPRLCRFDASGQFCYVVNELASRVTVLAYDNKGRLEPIQSLPTLEDSFSGDNISADLQMTVDGRFLYVSNRGHDSLACFRIDPESGRLERTGIFPCGGRTPRSFAISPDDHHLVVANQDSDCLVSFAIDRTDGGLQEVMRLDAPSPVCVCFV